MSPPEIQPHELMQRVADFFESQGITYWVVGSLASMAYGEPRFTNDVDIVAEIKLANVPALCKAFPDTEYYLSEAGVRDAIAHRFQFNIIHPASGLKVDVFVPPDTEFARSEAKRIRRITNEGAYSVWFSSPEDVLLSKLVYYRESGGNSEKHVRDIAGMAKLLSNNLDREYIEKWVAKLDVAIEWKKVQERIPELNS